MIETFVVQKEDNTYNKPPVDSHGDVPTAKYIRVDHKGGYYYQAVGTWTHKDLQEHNLFMFGIYADYGRDEAHRNKYPYPFIAPSRVLACRRFREKFSWLKIYKVEQITDTQFIDETLHRIRYYR